MKMKNSKTIALLGTIVILSLIIGYIVYTNYQEDLARYFRFKGAKFTQVLGSTGPHHFPWATFSSHTFNFPGFFS